MEVALKEGVTVKKGVERVKFLPCINRMVLEGLAKSLKDVAGELVCDGCFYRELRTSSSPDDVPSEREWIAAAVKGVRTLADNTGVADEVMKHSRVAAETDTPTHLDENQLGKTAVKLVCTASLALPGYGRIPENELAQLGLPADQPKTLKDAVNEILGPGSFRREVTVLFRPDTESVAA